MVLVGEGQHDFSWLLSNDGQQESCFVLALDISIMGIISENIRQGLKRNLSWGDHEHIYSKYIERFPLKNEGEEK